MTEGDPSAESSAPVSTTDADDEPGSPFAPLVVGAFLLAFGALALWQATKIPGEATSASGPKLLPIVVCGLWLVLAAVYTIGHLVRSRQGIVPREVERFSRVLAVGGVVAALVAYAFLLDPVGYLVATSVLFVLVARILGSRSLVRDIVIGLVLAIVIYFLFSRVLGIFLPAGVIPL